MTESFEAFVVIDVSSVACRHAERGRVESKEAAAALFNNVLRENFISSSILSSRFTDMQACKMQMGVNVLSRINYFIAGRAYPR